MTTVYPEPSTRVARAAERLRLAQADAELPCRDPEADGAETPGLVPEDWSDDGPRNVDAAVWCMRCPVRDLCGDYAITAREPWGVWGGMTASERRKLLRKRGVRI